jgi:hypothetical protein
MAIDKFKGKVGDVKGAAGGVKDAAFEKISQTLDEFNEAIPTIKAMGFAVTDLQVGVGPTPEVTAKLVGPAKGMQPEEIQGLINSNSDKKFLVTILKGLQTASNVQNRLGDEGFKNVEADITLGLTPSIKVGFLK